MTGGVILFTASWCKKCKEKILKSVVCLGKKNPTIKRVKLSMVLMQLSYFTIYFVEVLFRLILDGFESGCSNRIRIRPFFQYRSGVDLSSYVDPESIFLHNIYRSGVDLSS